MSKTRLMTAAALGTAGLLLTGCGASAPGVALQVGDERISVKRVDAAAESFCSALEDQIEAQGAAVPMRLVRQSTVQLLTVRSIAEQVAEEYDVSPGSTYGDELARQREQSRDMDEDVRRDFLELTTSQAYAADILDQVGRIRLEEQGVTDPAPDQVSQAGADFFQQWPDTHGLEVDPRYGLDTADGMLSPADTSVSVAVSDEAVAGLSSDPDVDQARRLPASQRCG